MASNRLGRLGERLARGYLVASGYRIVASSWRAGRVGEIDLIARRGRVLAFVEVKARRSGRFGRPEDAVDVRKQRRIERVAEAFLATLPRDSPLRKLECRLDVIAVDRTAVFRWRIRHLTGAFEGQARRRES